MATTPSPLKWHGGKHYLAPRIVAMMPPHTHYVEPFAGGLSVLLAKDPEGVSEVVNDLSGDLTHFWSILADRELFPRFQRMCEATPFSEAEWVKAEATIANEGGSFDLQADVRLAHAFFVRCRQSRAGRMEGFATLSRTRTRRGMNEQASAWLAAIEGLPAVHERLRRVVVLNRDALDVIRQQDGPGTLFYLDPPYLHGTRAVADAYEHEMTEEQHERLLNILGRIEGRFVLSGYRSELYDAHAAKWCPSWHRTDFDLPNNAAGGETKRRMTECVWTNFAPAANGRTSPPPRTRRPRRWHD